MRFNNNANQSTNEIRECELYYAHISVICYSVMTELPGREKILTNSSRYINLHSRGASSRSLASSHARSSKEIQHGFPLTNSASLTSILTHWNQSQSGLIPYSGGDVKLYQITKFLKMISTMDEHLCHLEMYSQHSKEWKYSELRHILDEQEYVIEDLEGEIERKEEQINKKMQEINEMLEGLTELENRLNDSYEANRRYREEKIMYEEWNKQLRDKLAYQHDIVKRLKIEVRDTDKRIKKLSVLHEAATGRAGVAKRSVKCQTKENFFMLLAKSEKKVGKCDSSVQVETMKPPTRPVCIDQATETV